MVTIAAQAMKLQREIWRSQKVHCQIHDLMVTLSSAVQVGDGILKGDNAWHTTRVWKFSDGSILIGNEHQVNEVATGWVKRAAQAILEVGNGNDS